jgi:glycerophosphoryl diester phosphodiesterase
MAAVLRKLIVAIVYGLMTNSALTAASAFDLQGHRGTRGLAPENTLEGFAVALRIGVDTLELDVAMSRDGLVAVHHDTVLNTDIARKPDGSYLDAPGLALYRLPLAEIRRYDVGRIKPGSPYARRFPEQQGMDGVRIPTLAEVFELVRRAGADHIRFNIETKLTPTSGADAPDPEKFARAVVEEIRTAGVAERASVQSFDWRTLAVVRQIAPEITRVCLSTQQPDEDTIGRGNPGPSPWTAGLDVDEHGGSTPRLAAAFGCAVWSPNFRDLSAALLDEARSLGLRVIPWTVNEPAEMERLLAWGVDGLITDYPDRARAVMRLKGMPLPPPVTLR